MNDKFVQLSMRIRELRDIAGYTPSEVAQELGVPTEVYEGYERNGEDVPVSAVYKLASLYKVDTTDILLGKSPKLDTICVCRKGDGMHVQRFAGYEYENIAYNFIHRTMEPMIVELDPEDNRPEMVRHSGQELNYCLAGQVLLSYDGKEIILSPGDSAYFDAKYPHGQMAAGNGKAKFLTVINE